MEDTNVTFTKAFKSWLVNKKRFDSNSTSLKDYARLFKVNIFSKYNKELNKYNENHAEHKLPKITKTEIQFFTIVPKMIKAFLGLSKEDERKEEKEIIKRDILALLYLASRSVTLSKVYYNNNINTKASDYRTYFNRYVEFVKKILKESNNILEIIIPALPSISDLEDKEKSQINNDLRNYIIYDFDSLRTKFRARLRTQDRNSGEKIWLPLTFISKIYTGLKQCNDTNKKDHKDDFTNWLEEIIKSIYIHYYDEDGSIKAFKFNNYDVAFLEFERANNQVWLIKKNGNRYLVATPTSTGNKKEKMSATDINKIDIDHVKPIERTLKELGNPPSNQLKQLEIISNRFRLLAEKNDSKAEQERTIKALIEELNFSDLKNELDSIRKDSPYRLMGSTKNSEKNNSLTFINYYRKRTKDAHYYGLIDEAVMDLENEKGIEVVIYQDLSENGVTRVMRKTKFKDITNGRIISISEVPIVLL